MDKHPTTPPRGLQEPKRCAFGRGRVGRASDRYDERVDGVIDALGFDPDATIREALTATAHPERKIFFCFGIRQLIVKDFVNHGFIWNSEIWDYSDLNLACSLVRSSMHST